MRKGLVIGLAMAIALGALAAPATAHKKKFPSTTTFNVVPQQPTGSGTSIYTGKVTSRNPACVGGRTVLVTNGAIVIARAVTDAAGNWSTPVSPDGGVNANALRKTLRNNRQHKHLCFRV